MTSSNRNRILVAIIHTRFKITLAIVFPRMVEFRRLRNWRLRLQLLFEHPVKGMRHNTWMKFREIWAYGREVNKV